MPDLNARLLDLLFGAAQSLLVAALTALVAFFFTKKYYSRVAFATKLKRYGFHSVRTSRPSERELRSLFAHSDRVRIVYVSGAGFLQGNFGIVEEALQKGKRIEILVSEKENRFLSDIEHLEKRARLRKKDTYIADEIDTIVRMVQELKRDNPEYARNLVLGHFGTEYRLPFIAGDYTYYNRGHHYRHAKVWLYVTLPPYRSSKSAILELKSDTRLDDESEDLDMIEMVDKHFEAILAKESPDEYWEKKKAEAAENMCAHAGGKRLLIECAAQHPLTESGEPGHEFAVRLDAAARLYLELTERGESVDIYVPGSLHAMNGVPDKCALAEAGCRYLEKKHGIPKKCLLGEAENARYKGDAGVYNSADECYVASRIFEDGDYRALYCVCSPYQTIRKTLLYYSFGVLPICYGIPAEDMFHDAYTEATVSLENLLYDDHTWQDESGWFYRQTRAERIPKGR